MFFDCKIQASSLCLLWIFLSVYKRADTSFISDIKTFLGGYNQESLIESIGKLLGKEGLFGYIKEFFTKLYKDGENKKKKLKKYMKNIIKNNALLFHK